MQQLRSARRRGAARSTARAGLVFAAAVSGGAALAQDVPDDSELLAAGAEAGGVYSGAGPDDCLMFAVDELGASVVCRGAFDFNLIVHDSDGRIFLGLVHPEWRSTAQIDPTPVVPGFSWLPADVVEWRVADGAPQALIVRLGVENAEGTERSQVSLVIRLAADDPEATCLVGAVTADADMDAEARAMAAEAAGRPCLGS